MKPKPKSKYFYTIARTAEHRGYEHLHARIYPLEEAQQLANSRRPG